MRHRYVMINGELVEVSLDYEAPARSGGASGDATLWNDRLYQDDNDPRYSSRSQHRDFMRRKGLTTVDDYTDTWREAEKRRLDFFQTGRDPSRKQDIINAIHKLENKRG